jgi:hypothetical protein
MRISCTFRLLDSRRTYSNCHRCGNNQLSAIGHGAQLASEFCHASNQVPRKMPLTSRCRIAPFAVQFAICLLEADTPRFLGIIDSVPGRLADAGERTKHNDGERWNLPARQQQKSNGCDGKAGLRKKERHLFRALLRCVSPPVRYAELACCVGEAQAFRGFRKMRIESS